MAKKGLFHIFKQTGSGLLVPGLCKTWGSAWYYVVPVCGCIEKQKSDFFGRILAIFQEITLIGSEMKSGHMSYA